MDSRIQIVAILAAAALLLGVLELVRQRKLLERYALVWMIAAIVLLGLAIWRNALASLADVVGISYPPNALFFVAFGAILLLLLHFSVAVSRLQDQTKLLAQRQALLEQRVSSIEAQPGEDGTDEERPAFFTTAQR